MSVLQRTEYGNQVLSHPCRQLVLQSVPPPLKGRMAARIGAYIGDARLFSFSLSPGHMRCFVTHLLGGSIA